MEKEIKAALISAIAGIIVGAMGMYATLDGNKKSQNQQVTVKIDGIEKIMSTDDFQKVVDGLENRIAELESEKISVPTATPAPTATLKSDTSIDLRSLKPIIGSDEDFWDESDGREDNLGNNEYSLMIYCEDGGAEITYPLDKKYSILRGNIALSGEDNKSEGLWLTFYDGKKKLGETQHMKAADRPSRFQIDVSNVTDLRIVTDGLSYEAGFLLTNGFELVTK